MSVRNLLPIALLLALMSAGCGGSPAKGDGVVSITQPSPPLTPIPDLAGGVVGTSPSGTGLASATVITFQFVTPPSGGVPPYTLSWNFGDGAAGAGSAPSHSYTNTGNFTATATVTDSRGISVQVSLPVSIRSVTGRWTATFGGVAMKPETIDIVQDQTAVTATINEHGRWICVRHRQRLQSAVAVGQRDLRGGRAGAIRRHLRWNPERHVADVDWNRYRLHGLSLWIYGDAAHPSGRIPSRRRHRREDADTKLMGELSIACHRRRAGCRTQNRTASGSLQSPRRTRSTARSRRFPWEPGRDAARALSRSCAPWDWPACFAAC